MKELIEIQKKLAVKKEHKQGNRYTYRKVDDILEAVKHLGIDGIYITMSDDVVCHGNYTYIKATATIHNSETSVSCSSVAKEGDLPGQSAPQISGSCSTYARKKALEGLLALHDGDAYDPDGEKPIKKATDEQIATLSAYITKFTEMNQIKWANAIEDYIDSGLSFESAEGHIERAKELAGE